MAKAMTSNALTKHVIQQLNNRGWHVWRENSGYSGKPNLKLAPSGTPDIIGFDDLGGFVGIEIKGPGDKIRDSQIEFFWELSRTRQGVGGIIRSVDQFEQWLGDLYDRERRVNFQRCQNPYHFTGHGEMLGVWEEGDAAGPSDPSDKAEPEGVREDSDTQRGEPGTDLFPELQ